MRRSFRHLAALSLLNIVSLAALAQSVTITGNVRNSSSKDVVPSVSVIIKGTSAGTFTDEKGNFRLNTTQKPPFTLVFTSVGFEPQEVTVNNVSDVVQIDLVPSTTIEVPVVISASRVPERILESPVSIERLGLANIRNSPAATYYDALFNLKGVDMTTSSLTFRTVGTRGFNGSGNVRLNQIVDGMDNQAPGLNFSVGSVIGLTELDVESVELLPGASSALYGPGGMNGTLLINSKSPFKYQGLSYQIKQGIMHTDKKQRSNPAPYYDWSFRWAKTIGNRFAFKLGGQFIHAKDWIANDSTDYQRVGTTGFVKPGNRYSDPNYDGINVYGDETTVDIRPFIQGAIAASPGLAPILTQFLASPLRVSRTGYREREVVNNNTINIRLSGGLYYKLTDNVEASLIGYLGSGNTVYTGSDRYSLKDLKMAQYKLELKHRNWFLRGYTTQENSGEAYNATVTTRLFNEAWKPSYNPGNLAGSWYPQYVGIIPGQTTGFIPLAVGIFSSVLGAGGTLAQAQAAVASAVLQLHSSGRATADIGRPAPATPGFTSLYDQVRKIPIPKGGLFVDRTDLWAVEGQYNFTEMIKLFELLVGGNYKKYVLNSNGTLFADKPGSPINIGESGGYAQASKKFFKDFLKLTASGRYDKNQNFDGRFTPRVTAVLQPKKDHNIRLSYQTAYRFPTTQQQWIDLDVGGSVRLLGCLPYFWDKYDLIKNPVYTLESVQPGPPVVFTPVKVKPESVTSYEIGYKSLIAKKLLIDVYAYWGQYENFLTRRLVIQSPGTANQKIFSMVVNTPGKVKTTGWGASVDYLLPKNFSVSANVSSDDLSTVPTGYQGGFNTPKHRINISLANSGFGNQKRLSSNVTWRWQEAFQYESDFANGTLPDFYVVDAQVSYKMPKSRSILKLGANNLFNQYYRTAMGNPYVGGLYYISYGYNVY